MKVYSVRVMKMIFDSTKRLMNIEYVMLFLVYDFTKQNRLFQSYYKSPLCPLPMTSLGRERVLDVQLKTLISLSLTHKI